MTFPTIELRREYYRKRTKSCKDRGICVICQQKPASTGHVCCDNCLLQKRINTTVRLKKNSSCDVRRILCEQKVRCDICSIDITKKYVIDHDHKTLKFRGLLCSSCNNGLGLFKDNISLFANAIKYLNKES